MVIEVIKKEKMIKEIIKVIIRLNIKIEGLVRGLVIVELKVKED